MRLRGLADRVGFAHLASQMDAVVRRIEERTGTRIGERPSAAGDALESAWRFAIAPHDDYAYAGHLYPLVLRGVRAPTVVIFGVAHKARALQLENRIVFDSFTHWHGPYGNIPVSPLREALTAALDPGHFVVHDEMQAIEHSVEAKLPFLQHYRRDIRIVSILVPAMPHERMREIAAPLGRAIADHARQNHLEWGKDFALVASTDAVHYGDEGWGGRDFARYGTDEAGYRRAVEHDAGIMKECLAEELAPAKAALFSRSTVRDDDWREYRWTWCGRYSVPFAMLAAHHLQQALGAPPLVGEVLGYATSIDAPRVPVEDLQGMGVTAPANLRHWVGYAAVGYP